MLARALEKKQGKTGESGKSSGAQLARRCCTRRRSCANKWGERGADNDSLRLFCHQKVDRWAARTMELTGRMDAQQCLAGWERRNIDRSVNQSNDSIVTKSGPSD